MSTVAPYRCKWCGRLDCERPWRVANWLRDTEGRITSFDNLEAMRRALADCEAHATAARSRLNGH